MVREISYQMQETYDEWSMEALRKLSVNGSAGALQQLTPMIERAEWPWGTLRLDVTED